MLLSGAEVSQNSISSQKVLGYHVGSQANQDSVSIVHLLGLGNLTEALAGTRSRASGQQRRGSSSDCICNRLASLGSIGDKLIGGFSKKDHGKCMLWKNFAGN